jgi:hypothetical protein
MLLGPWLADIYHSLFLRGQAYLANRMVPREETARRGGGMVHREEEEEEEEEEADEEEEEEEEEEEDEPDFCQMPVIPIVVAPRLMMGRPPQMESVAGQPVAWMDVDGIAVASRSGWSWGVERPIVSRHDGPFQSCSWTYRLA